MRTACALLHPYAIRVRFGLPFHAVWCDLCDRLHFPETPTGAQPSAQVPPLGRGNAGLRWAPRAYLSGLRPG